MSYRIINTILKDEEKTWEEKIKLIEKLLEIKEEIDHLAEEGKISRSEAIERIAKEKKIDVGPIESHKIREAIERGVEWLKSEQHRDNGWGWIVWEWQRKKLAQEVPEDELKNSTKTNAGSTSLSILALNAWKEYLGNQSLNEVINGGIEWLKDENNYNQEGGWGPYPTDLPIEIITNVFDTSFSVLALLEIEKDKLVSKSIETLKKLQKERCWMPSKEDQKKDVGATSLAIQALIEYNKDKSKENIKKGIEWLIDNRQDDGGWSDTEKGVRKSVITRTYDALDAIIKYDPDLEEKGSKQAVEKGSKWLLDSIRFIKEYLFSWDDVPGNDSEKLLRFLRDDLDIDWAENAEILKLDDGKTIHIFKDENSAEIKIDENKGKATLIISDGEKAYDLKVKKEDGKLNIYVKDKVGLAWRRVKIGEIEMSDIENTATAVTALLDCGVGPSSLEVEEGINWLLERQGWGSDTPRVILCLIRFMEKMYGKR